MRRFLRLLTRPLVLALVAALAAGNPERLSAQEPTPPPSPPPETQPEPEASPPPPTETAPVPAEKPPAEMPVPRKSGATLRGRILRADRRTPLPAAVVYAVDEGGTRHSSPPADERGRYLLPDLAPGNYSLYVVTEEGAFSLESPVGITSAHVFTVDLATVPAEAATKTVPGVGMPPRGFAYLLQGKNRGGTTFWKGPKGITLIVASALALTLALSGDSHHEKKPVSPSVP